MDMLQIVVAVAGIVISALISIGIPILLHISSRHTNLLEKIDSKIDRISNDQTVLRVELARVESVIYGVPCVRGRGECHEQRTAMVQNL
jgi:hypothetical protein